MEKKILFLAFFLIVFLFLTVLTFMPRAYSAVRQRPFRYNGYVPQSTFVILKHKANLTKFLPPPKKKVITPVSSVKKALTSMAGLFKIKSSGVTKKPVKQVIKKYTAYGFNFNSYAITKLLRQRLNYIKTLIRNRSQHLSVKDVISITGYTDRYGTKSYNNKLALERALSAEKYLGLKNIKLSGYGKCCYVSKRNFKNRRVVVKIQN